MKPAKESYYSSSGLVRSGVFLTAAANRETEEASDDWHLRSAVVRAAYLRASIGLGLGIMMARMALPDGKHADPGCHH